jgi:cytochrome b subunit of formate dehydrogenase
MVVASALLIFAGMHPTHTVTTDRLRWWIVAAALITAIISGVSLATEATTATAGAGVSAASSVR